MVDFNFSSHFRTEHFGGSSQPAYNPRGSDRHALAQQSCHNPPPSLRLPPIRESSSRENYGYATSPDIMSTYRGGAPTSSRGHNMPRTQPTNQPTYGVLAPSGAGDTLIPVKTSNTKAPGILRGHLVTAGMQGDDAKKKFQCSVCGRKMERHSVYKVS